MHLGNGAVTPECGAIALGVAVAGGGIAWNVSRKQPLTQNHWMSAGILGSLVFAAQMFNVDVFSFGAAHLVGGVLLAWTLGPALGLLTMSAVLVVQAVVLGDGGTFALGTNIINMAVVPAAIVALARKTLARKTLARKTIDADSSPLRTLTTVGLASFLSILAAAGLIVGEVALFRSAGELEGFSAFATQMISTHAVFGMLEAATTVALVACITGWPAQQSTSVEITRQRTAGLAAAAMLIAVLCIPAVGIVSTSPDGYATAIQQADFNNGKTDW